MTAEAAEQYADRQRDIDSARQGGHPGIFPPAAGPRRTFRMQFDPNFDPERAAASKPVTLEDRVASLELQAAITGPMDYLRDQVKTLEDKVARLENGLASAKDVEQFLAGDPIPAIVEMDGQNPAIQLAEMREREQPLIENLAPTDCTLVKVLGMDDAYYILTDTRLGSGSQDDILRFQSSDRLTLEQAEKWVAETS